jgi:hypothetical protein
LAPGNTGKPERQQKHTREHSERMMCFEAKPNYPFLSGSIGSEPFLNPPFPSRHHRRENWDGRSELGLV